MRGAPSRPPLGRLTKRSDFLAAAAGRRFQTVRMTVQGRIRGDEAGPDGLRVGFTVTKRVGHATERNRIRRRLRRAALDASGAHADMPVDVVVVARREALAAAYAALVEDLERALTVVTKQRPKPARSDRPSSPTRGETPREASHA